MKRWEKAIENHKKGYNCAQAVACSFSDELGFCENDLFKLTEAFGGGMGGTQGVCGAVSGMVLAAGVIKSLGVEMLPETNKAKSYEFARELISEFENKIGSVQCSEIKGKQLCSCDGCIAEAVKILEKYFG